MRRAEAAWREAAGERPLPPATALASFAAFTDPAILFAAAGPPPARLRVLKVGRALSALDLLRPTGADGAQVRARLVAAARAAFAQGAPHWVEIGPDAAPGQATRLALRAIALPFAPPPGAAQPTGLVLVVVSWRELLSDEATRSLAQELDRLRPDPAGGATARGTALGPGLG
ncbi:MAG: hypothetical protein NZM40_06770 [Sphingomonadaceae bacterium]|uniref:hypothetical protein n=1 Tax=Thermaurantiacus sp. TaxID=2820283 RepID=UPI00298F292E|nr:hypothetical protein [Thermaurantiacus sp.]MCS6987119.1 hypothetical protein [Sphingomonadaceae bacterium]MDW8415848.1 hypothetical protein [Thermaurantiacus sp.]